MSAFVTNVWELFAMRLIVGIGIGADIPTAMAFLAEVATKERRGATLGSLSQTLWTAGAILSVIVALVISSLAGNETWRWLLGFGALPAFIVLVLRQTLPESPRWLIMRGKVKEAEEACRRLGMADNEFQEIQRVSNTKQAIVGQGWGKKISLVAVVFWLNALAGAASTISSPYIFKYVSHASTTGSLLFTLMLWGFNFLGTIAGSFIIDKISHKSLALLSQIPTIAFAVLMAFTKDHPGIFVPAFFLFGFFDWGGASALQWAWGSELFPTQFRAFSQGIINGAGRVAVIMVTFLMPIAIGTIGFSYTMIALAVPVVIYCVIVATNPLFETTGMSLEDIELRESAPNRSI
ncbi:MAG: MFS transporter [Bacilli bacterium]